VHVCAVHVCAVHVCAVHVCAVVGCALAANAQVDIQTVASSANFESWVSVSAMWNEGVMSNFQVASVVIGWGGESSVACARSVAAVARIGPEKLQLSHGLSDFARGVSDSAATGRP